MSIGELILELRAVRESFDWKYFGGKRQVRGIFRKGNLTTSFDPIAALCFIKTGKVFESYSWLEAGAAIGLSDRDCSDIIDACNNQTFGQSIGAVRHDSYHKWLRRQLTFAVGLTSFEESREVSSRPTFSKSEECLPS